MYELDHVAATDPSHLALRCPECLTVGHATPGEQVYTCASCHKVWELAACPDCGDFLLMELGFDPEEQFICPWCARKGSIGHGPRPSAEVVADRISERGADYFNGDVILRGLTVVGVFGMPITTGSRITVSVSSDSLIFGTVPWDGLTFRILHYDLVSCDVTSDLGSVSSGHVEREASANGNPEGTIDWGLVEILKGSSQLNTFLKLSTAATDLYAHHSSMSPEQVRSHLARALDAMAARGNGVNEKAAGPSEPPAQRAETLLLLSRLRQSGALSDEEFNRATQRVLQQSPGQ
jgi:hypothetical protein